MIYDDFTAFAAHAADAPPWLGLDLGTKTIGIAVSDALLSIATPLQTLKRGKLTQDLAQMQTLLKTRGGRAIVLGLPRNMDGSEGPRCQSTRAFARHLDQNLLVDIAFWDERLSTVAAERALLEADATRKRRARVIDHVAAAYILQGALDRLQHLRT